jgi:hypothetical protein
VTLFAERDCGSAEAVGWVGARANVLLVQVINARKPRSIRDHKTVLGYARLTVERGYRSVFALTQPTGTVGRHDERPGVNSEHTL